MLAATVLLAASACSGSNGTPADAGADVPLDTGADTAPPDGGVDTAPLACDPAAQNCPVDRKCDFRCDGNNAVVDCGSSADGGAVGSTCSTITIPCARGTGCIVMPSSGPLCRKYCSVDGDCATGERCHNVTVGVTCATTTNFLLHFCY